MAKEFDIYLNNHLTQCDIIVYSIPYRDGITVDNHLILENCLKSYILQKIIAVKTDSAIVSHIDEMIKICYERLNFNTTLGTNAEFYVCYSVLPADERIEIKADEIPLLATSFVAAENAMRINAAPLLAYIGKSIGSGASSIRLDSIVKDILKNSLISANCPSELETELSGLHVNKYLKTDSVAIPSILLKGLFYQKAFSAETQLYTSCNVLGTEFHYPLGNGQSRIIPAASVLGEHLTGFVTTESAINIMSSVAGMIVKCMTPATSNIIPIIDVSPILKRHTLLKEIDPNEIAHYDDMSLEEIDYVII